MWLSKEEVREKLSRESPRLTPFRGLKRAAVLVPIVRTADQSGLLYIKRSEEVQDHKGEVAFPGGQLEEGERPLDAALREAKEEIGLEDIDVLGRLDDYVTVTGYHVVPFVVWVEHLRDIGPRTPETSETFVVPIGEFLEDGAIEVREFLWKGRVRRVYFFRYRGREIWGATMAITVGLLRRLELLHG